MGNNLANTLPRLYKGNNSITSYIMWQEMTIIFLEKFILIKIVESKYFKNYFVTVCCSEAEVRLT